jgi:hypothetical protein
MADIIDTTYENALTALNELLSGAQSYTLPNGLTVTRQDLDKVRRAVAFLESRRSSANAAPRRIVLRDRD